MHIITTNKLYKPVGNDFRISTTNTDSVEFVLTKQDYIPVHIKIFRSKYIQNDTINQDTEYTTNYDYIYIGRNVTENKPQGKVVIISGNSLTLKAKKEIELKNSFEVPLGAEFSIDIE